MSSPGTSPPTLSPEDLAALPAPDLYRHAEAMGAAGQVDAAVAGWDAYAADVPAMVDLAAMGAGQAQFAAGRFAAAAQSFAVARDDAGDATTAFLAALRLGNALLRTGPAEAALAAYDDAYARAEDDVGRSQSLAGRIAVLVAGGRDADAVAVRRRLVHDLPRTELARAALERLETAGEDVPPDDAAAVAAGAGEHRRAVDLWQVAIAGAADPPAAWTRSLAASREALGERDEVVALVDEFLAARSGDPLAPDLARMRADALDRMDRDREAAEALADLATRWPTAPGASEALRRRAALVQALDGPIAGAAALDDLIARHPRQSWSEDDGFRAGFLYWRGGDLARATERWSVVGEDGRPVDRSRASYWLGRAAYDAGAADLAAHYWSAAADAEPFGYYGVRAAERLGRAPSPGPPDGGDPDADVAAWLASWRPDFQAAQWRAVRAKAAAERGIARAAAWLDLGERKSAGRALSVVARALDDDTVALAAVAFEAERLGLHEVAVFAAVEVIAGAPEFAEPTAPAALWRLAYPDAYGDLVRLEADRAGVPADLLFALVRQESRFDPTARSSAGASGLTQVMPGTGEGIAAALDLPGFSAADLYRPELSLRFGAWYLSRQLERFGGRPWVALAAYNGGPGNAARWLDAAGDDRDLFVESIDFRETRRYVQLVEAQRARYAWLYPDLR